MAAPTTVIEAVTIVRPLKVIGFTFEAISLIFTTIGLLSSAWLEAQDYRQGLWLECTYTDHERLTLDCFQPKGWVRICAVLIALSFIVVLCATACLGTGLNSTDYKRKFILYRLSMYGCIASVILLVIALVVFPAKFMGEIESRHKTEWKFAWAYGLVWLATILQFGAAILLLVDMGVEEIYYREKTVGGEDEDVLTENIEPIAENDTRKVTTNSIEV